MCYKKRVIYFIFRLTFCRFRGLNLAIEMYTDICRHVRTPFMICDVMEGSLERIVGSTWLFAMLDRLGIRSWFVGFRRRSYQIITQSGEEEQFEKIVICRNRLGFFITLYDWYIAIQNKPRTSKRMIIVGLTSTLVAVYCYKYFKSN